MSSWLVIEPYNTSLLVIGKRYDNNKLLPSPEGAMHTKFGKDWPCRFWEEDDKGRRTTDNERWRRPTHSIGHLSDSGDLKYPMFYSENTVLLELYWHKDNSFLYIDNTDDHLPFIIVPAHTYENFDKFKKNLNSFLLLKIYYKGVVQLLPK